MPPLKATVAYAGVTLPLAGALYQEVSVTVPGAQLGMVALAAISVDVPAGGVITARVSAANTVKVVLAALPASYVYPAGLLTVQVFQ